jgi:hypothetical protein
MGTQLCRLVLTGERPWCALVLMLPASVARLPSGDRCGSVTHYGFVICYGWRWFFITVP